MAGTKYTLTQAADAANRILASGDTDIVLSNPNRNRVVRWTITPTTTAPTDDPKFWSAIKPLESRDITIPDTEYLWMACEETGAFSWVEA